MIAVQTVELNVDGLDCAGCAKRASTALKGVKGARMVRVSKADKSETITYEVKRTSPTKIVAALKKA